MGGRVREKRADLQAFEAAKYGRAPYRAKPTHRIYSLEDPKDEDISYTEDDIIKHVEDFYRDLFSDLSNTHILPTWIFETFRREDLDNLGFFDGATLQILILEMPLGKVGTDDTIVVEMLRQLDLETLDILADMFAYA